MKLKARLNGTLMIVLMLTIWQPAALATTTADEIMQDYRYEYLGNLREAKGTLYSLKANAASPDAPHFYHQMLELLAQTDESYDLIQQLSTEETITGSDERLKNLYEWQLQLSSSFRQLSSNAKSYGQGTDLDGMKEALSRMLEERKKQIVSLYEKLQDIRQDYPEQYFDLSYSVKANYDKILSLVSLSNDIASVEDYNKLWMQAEAVGFDVRFCTAMYNALTGDVAEGDLMDDFRSMNAESYEKCLSMASDILTYYVEKLSSREAPHFYHRMRTTVARLDRLYRANLNRQVTSEEEFKEFEQKYYEYLVRMVEFRQLVDYYTQGVDLDGMKTELEQVLVDQYDLINDFLNNIKKAYQSYPALIERAYVIAKLWKEKCYKSAQVIDGITSVEDYNKMRMEFEAFGIDIRMDIQRFDELFRIVQTDDLYIIAESLMRHHANLNNYLQLVSAELRAAATMEQAPELYEYIKTCEARLEALLFRIKETISSMGVESDDEAVKEQFFKCQEALNDVARTLEEVRQQVRELSNGSEDELTAAKEDLQKQCDMLEMITKDISAMLEKKATREQAPELYAELEDCYTMLTDISYHISEITSLDDAKQWRAALDRLAARLKNLSDEVEALDNKNIIAFEDETVKTICVENWDTDGDGELSYDEAAAVTDIGDAFNYTSIKSFNEFQYFTGITQINSFHCMSLESIVLPPSLSKIGWGAFRYCSSLTSIAFGDNLVSIGGFAFADCKKLSSIYIPKNVSYIGAAAFGWCNLDYISVSDDNPVYRSPNNCNAVVEVSNGKLVVGTNHTTILESVKIIGDRAFAGCEQLQSVTLPEGLTEIQDWAFSQCGFRKIFIPKNVKVIGENPLPQCNNLIEVTVDAANTTYDSRDNCDGIIETQSNTLIVGIAATEIPNTVTTIGAYAYYDCRNLTYVHIPASVTRIAQYAFGFNSKLQTITIPNTVKVIDDSAFYASYLTSIYTKIEEPYEISDNAFLGIYREQFFANAILYVPVGTKALYEATAGWRQFQNIVETDEDPDGLESIASSADTRAGAIYNISGQRLNKPSRGLNIINGKKVAIK